MTKFLPKALFICMLVVMLSATTYGQSKTATIKTQAQPPLKLEPPVTTTHTITINGKKVEYQATVGYLEQDYEKGKTQGYFFYTAYVKKGSHQANRPLSFCFNGGPGSSSFYLHLLTIGPRKAVLGKDGNTLSPPPRLVDNPNTWLEVTDIVMVDPIGTGFSRPAPGVDGGMFWGVREDAKSVADFIRMYLTRNNRWLSPIYIAGESYGGIRGALLAHELQNHNQIGLDINGLIYISPALEMLWVFVRDHDAMGMTLYFPTYCTTAWYHKKVAPEFQSDFKKLESTARTFAFQRYLPALLKGSKLSQEEMKKVAIEMSRITGLSVEFIMLHKLRITSEEFRNELLKNKHMPLDRLDARFKTGTYDLTQTLSPLINHYLRQELGYKTPRPYTNSARFFRGWKWDPFSLTVLPQLAETINNNPSLMVFSAAGYYDYACPYFSIDFCLDQLQLDEGLKKNIIRKYYHAGHMVYTPSDDLVRFNNDVKEFIRSTSGDKKD
jgi:carboxypeptidase C (cathepsin A)